MIYSVLLLLLLLYLYTSSSSVGGDKRTCPVPTGVRTYQANGQYFFIYIAWRRKKNKIM
jgi:hypothetical protein